MLKILKVMFLTTVLCLVQVQSVAGEVKNFELKDISGKKHVLQDYRGKWVFVNFWATWCPPCLEEVPDLVGLYDARKGKDVMVIGVVIDYDTEQVVSKYVDEMLMTYPIVLGDAKSIAQFGSAEILPTTYIYNPRGELVKVKRGLLARQYLEDLIAKGSQPLKR
ncbi:MAG: TlpA disulfide reductase family protein [Methylophilus sp.]|nr:TlpA disulfide reductase family protein [Methylophilus sp.]